MHSGPAETEMNPPEGSSADAQRVVSALGRYGTPADVAAMVGLLAGPEGWMISSASLLVDGGADR